MACEETIERRGGAFRRPGRLGAALVSALLCLGCANAIDRTPPPAATYRQAQVPDFPPIRFFGDKAPPETAFDIGAWERNRLPILRAEAGPGERPHANALLLSGGGPDGAFGAGLLNGWTATGARPTFEIVTGVSIGALMAPFAFLGPDYDDELREMFLTIEGDESVFAARILAVLGGAPALTDNAPLRALIARYVTESLLDAVAEEHRLGRRLFAGTTYLDARRPMTWNLGAIAASDNPARVQLFRDVLLASASIPGVVAPVLVDVEIDGERFSEMHVDGGVMNSVFVAAPDFFLGGGRSRALRDLGATVWIIQNNKLRAPYGPNGDSFVDITRTSLSETLRSQARGDQTRLFFVARDQDVNYRLAAVPVAFDETGASGFDPEYLRRLYETGETLALDGYPWRLIPPSIERRMVPRPTDDERFFRGPAAPGRGESPIPIEGALIGVRGLSAAAGAL